MQRNSPQITSLSIPLSKACSWSVLNSQTVASFHLLRPNFSPLAPQESLHAPSCQTEATRFGDSNREVTWERHGSTAQLAVLSEPGNGPCPSRSESRTLLGSHAWRECHGEDGKSSLPHTDPKTRGNAGIQAIMCTARCRPSRETHTVLMQETQLIMSCVITGALGNSETT